jgi:mono/diheme cytochrome c family protein
MALVVDEDNGELVVASWGGETLEVFDLVNRNRVDEIDLGYANLNDANVVYPANNIEVGEYLFYNTDWSNDGRKACSSCHGPDNLISDGLPYANGATAATVPHNVKANWNLLRTDNYFWNGSFANGGYASVAFAAQTRTRCEQIAFATVEGPSTNAAARIGNPAVTARGFGDNDAACQPDEDVDADRLPANFNIAGGIAETIAQQKLDAANAIVALAQNLGGAAANIQVREDVSRFNDYYSVYELRLPPNPLKYLAEAGELSSTDAANITKGEALFASVGCTNCHDPANSRAPFTDGLQHGLGADYNRRFVDQYEDDERVILPQQFIDSLDGDGSIPSPEINIHLTPGDFFIPFCFDTVTCLKFEDPLAQTGDFDEESRRLNLINQFNLDDPERGFNPGQPLGSGPRINTPSLRGSWWLAGYLHHAFARNLREAILSPGHPALRPGEIGYAISSGAFGEDAFDSHGATQNLSDADMTALELYIETIE